MDNLTTTRFPELMSDGGAKITLLLFALVELRMNDIKLVTVI